MKSEVTLVPTGAANLASVKSAFAQLGYSTKMASSPQEILDAGHVVLPGVGAFAAAMSHLQDRGFDAPLRERIRREQPFLGICLGLQLLSQASEESPGIEGLCVLSSTVRKLRAESCALPHMGWNRVSAPEGSILQHSGNAYFAHSYCLDAVPRDWRVSTAKHGETFVAAVERGNCLALQFHPELSGDWGLSLLERWLLCR